MFKALGLTPGTEIASTHPADHAIPTSRVELIAALQDLRNDLEPPARAMAPEIDAALAALAATGAPLVRMSGSGATVFGLYEHAGQGARGGCGSPSRPSRLVGAGDPAALTGPAQVCAPQRKLLTVFLAGM